MDNKIGKRLRKLRKSKSITLEELSNQTGFSYSYLSNLENGKHSITIKSLSRIASFFEVDMTFFFVPDHEQNKPIITRKEEDKYLTEDEIIFKGVSPKESKLFRVTMVEFTDKSEHTPDDHSHFPGEEQVYILSGKILLTIDNLPYILDQGDSIFFRSELKHYMVALEKPSSLLIVLAYY